MNVMDVIISMIQDETGYTIFCYGRTPDATAIADLNRVHGISIGCDIMAGSIEVGLMTIKDDTIFIKTHTNLENYWKWLDDSAFAGAIMEQVGPYGATAGDYIKHYEFCVADPSFSIKSVVKALRPGKYGKV